MKTSIDRLVREELARKLFFKISLYGEAGWGTLRCFTACRGNIVLSWVKQRCSISYSVQQTEHRGQGLLTLLFRGLLALDLEICFTCHE